MDAEEIVHDTMIKYINSNISISVPQQEEAWLVKTTIRSSIDYLRKRKSYLNLVEDYKIDLSNKVIDNNQKMEVDRIKQALMLLPDGYRSILSLVLFEGYDYEEIASIFKIKESTVRSQYLRGKSKLLSILNCSTK